MGAGLAANASGHASYMLFRAARLTYMRAKRDARSPKGHGKGRQLPFNYPFFSGYQTKPLLELEMFMLTAGAAALLLVPAPALGPI